MARRNDQLELMHKHSFKELKVVMGAKKNLQRDKYIDDSNPSLLELYSPIIVPRNLSGISKISKLQSIFSNHNLNSRTIIDHQPPKISMKLSYCCSVYTYLTSSCELPSISQWNSTTIAASD